MTETPWFTRYTTLGHLCPEFSYWVFAVLAVMYAAAPPSTRGQSFQLTRTYNDPTVTNADVFGYSVALDNGLVLIGTPNDDTMGVNVGQAHLFDAVTGTHLKTFNDPMPTGFDNFGFSVALDNGLALIGAYFDDTNGANVGQAHLFDVTTGDLLRTFDDPTPTVGDQFGISVALDGGHVLIGAPYDDTNGSAAGQAHLFDAASGTLLQTFDDPTPKSSTFGDLFGKAVALDGGLVLIGDQNDSTHGIGRGQAHLFDAFTGDLLRTYDEPTPGLAGNRASFGSSVALDGGLVLIGAQGRLQAHLFDAITGGLLRTFDDPTDLLSGGNFGASVDLDGGLALIGEPNDRPVNGSAHLFDVATGDLLWTFKDPTLTQTDQFGSSVALDGGYVLIGAPFDDTHGDNVGQAHFFSSLIGDLNGDGFVGIDDLDMVLYNWNQTIPPGDPIADPSGDSFVGLADLDIVLVNWNAGTPPGEDANIPESGTLALMSGIGLVILRR